MQSIFARITQYASQFLEGFRGVDIILLPSHSRLDRLKTRRKLWLKVHLYLGLFAGAVLVLISLTGSVLVFWQEIDAWLNPKLMLVEASAEGSAAYRPLEEIVAAADAAISPGAKRSYIFYPRHPDLAFWFVYQGPAVTPEEANTLNVFVDPYTAEVTGTRIKYHAHNPLKHCFMGFIFKLHYSLLLGTKGALLVGILAVLFAVSVLTGLIVWWPLAGKWRQALTIKRRASVERLNHDLHKTFGVYSSLVLLLVLVSGVYFNLPDQFLWLVERFSPVSRLQDFVSVPRAGRLPLSPDQILARIRQSYPDEQLYWFSVPEADTGAYVFTLQKSVADLFIGRHQLMIDRYSGEVLGDFSPTLGNGGQIFIQWQWPLHSGHALGITGRILVFLSGLTCPILYVTGVIRWLQKRRAALRVEERSAKMISRSSSDA